MSTATPYTTLLVANRGEIALRILRTARRLGLRTVAVCADPDAQAPHVHAADRAVRIGPAQSYLCIDAIVAAARASGADAVHPGYGFLAENADFAQACRDAGLVFVGPSPQAIRAMGDKAAAKRQMQQAGVPCIPGWQGEGQDPARLAAEADRLGYPLMVKATAGGGGRGMRLVHAAADFPQALHAAQAEALAAVGDGTVLLERAIARPRHVEVQVVADRHGQVVHLGERDCSVQRRHQKLVEEAPSPAVGDALRERMGQAAVAAARAIGYEGAGTLEFLLDADGGFWFMEMNTRLQVEHPVTEARTGLDLVEWQLRVAAGEPLPLAQDAIAHSGHAIEVRLCAEDPQAGFFPQAGTLHRWRPPAGLRVEHALHDGAQVPPDYDSMVAKLVAHGATRDEARLRLRSGLQQLVALGLRTNQALLAAVLDHPVFAAGQATTAFLDEHGAQLLARDAAALRRAAILGAALLQASAPGATLGGRGLLHGLPVPMRLAVDGEPVAVEAVQPRPGQFELLAQGTRASVQVLALHDGMARVALDGVQHDVAWHRAGERLWLALDGVGWAVDDHTLAPSVQAAGAGGDGRVRASTEGRVVAVHVARGAGVAAGQPLVTLEAMKMQHVQAAPVAGTVAAVHVAVGEQVAARRLLVEVVG